MNSMALNNKNLNYNNTNQFEKIQEKSKEYYIGFISEYKVKGQEQIPVSFKNVIEDYKQKKEYDYKYLSAANLVILQLIQQANNFKGIIQSNTSTLVDKLAKINDNIEVISIENYKKTLERLQNDGLIYLDYTRYYSLNDKIVTYTGLLSGEYPAYKDSNFINLINNALKYDNFEDFCCNCCFKDFKLDILKEGFDLIHESGLAFIDLEELVYYENKFKYINFNLLKIISPFYDCLKYAHKNKWEKSGIIEETYDRKRKDNYQNRHIYLNVDMLADITTVFSVTNTNYNNYRSNKKRRVLRLCRTLGIMLYKGLLKFANKGMENSKYYDYMNKKRSFEKVFQKKKISDSITKKIFRKAEKQAKIKYDIELNYDSIRNIFYEILDYCKNNKRTCNIELKWLILDVYKYLSKKIDIGYSQCLTTVLENVEKEMLETNNK